METDSVWASSLSRFIQQETSGSSRERAVNESGYLIYQHLLCLETVSISLPMTTVDVVFVTNRLCSCSLADRRRADKNTPSGSVSMGQKKKKNPYCVQAVFLYAPFLQHHDPLRRV